MSIDPAPSAGPAGPSRVLVATGAAALLDDLLRLAAAAGVEVEAAPDAVSARRAWSTAAGVLVGDDLAPDLLLRPPGRRDGVVLVGNQRSCLDASEAGMRAGYEAASTARSQRPDGRPSRVSAALPGEAGSASRPASRSSRRASHYRLPASPHIMSAAESIGSSGETRYRR